MRVTRDMAANEARRGQADRGADGGAERRERPAAESRGLREMPLMVADPSREEPRAEERGAGGAETPPVDGDKRLPTDWVERLAHAFVTHSRGLGSHSEDVILSVRERCRPELEACMEGAALGNS